MRSLVAAVALLSVVSSARADWLDDAWDARRVTVHGNPSITHGAHGTSVTIPEQVLADAAAGGLSTREAVTAFLGRYAPGHCSDIVDMTVPHAGMKVVLRTQHLRPPREGQAPQKMFEVSEVPITLTIDYVPAIAKRCIDPGTKFAPRTS